MRVLVCGTNYGATYLRALSISNGAVKLAGILSQGSQRSLTYASHFNVPHFTVLEQVPEQSCDIACVAISGELGHALVIGLLSRGIHVLCEHPIDSEQMQKALQCAKAHNCVFHVNAHFADLNAPQAFFNALATASQMGQCLHYSLSLNLRTLYSGLDLLGRAMGSLDSISVKALRTVNDKPQAFEQLQLSAPNVSVSLLCQNFASEVDDGSATLINHRCSAMFAHGNLLLSESNGPVLWFPTPVSMPPDSWKNVLPVEMASIDQAQLQHERDIANLCAVECVIRVVQGQENPYQQSPEYLLQLSSLWIKVLSALQSTA